MKLSQIFSMLFALAGPLAFAQVGIDNINPDPSSVLDLSSTSKGVLIPRMTTAQRQGIVSPASGLLVFDTTINKFFYFINTQWIVLDAWTGGASSSISYTAGSVGVGTTTPRGKFDVDGTGDIYLSDEPVTGSTQSVYLPGHIFIAPYSGNLSFLQARRKDDTGSTALRIRTFNNGVINETMHLESNGNVGIATTTPAYKLDVNGSMNATSIYVNGQPISAGNGVPAGGIIMWSGSVASIPAGWALCNGANGTPDLRERFIVGAGGDNPAVTFPTTKNTYIQNAGPYNPGAVGGINTILLEGVQSGLKDHHHDIYEPGHSHTYIKASTTAPQSGSATPVLFNTVSVQTSKDPSGVKVLKLIGDGTKSTPYPGSIGNTTAGTAYYIDNPGELKAAQESENRPPFYALAFIMKL
jgi:hypothetical protein